MKKIILTSLLLLIVFTSCTTEVDDFMDEGTIKGYDNRECICCGGYFIDISNTTYRFYTIPENSNLDLTNPSFPISVNLKWKEDEPQCLGDEIIVIRIEKR